MLVGVLLFGYVNLHGFVCNFPLKLQMNKVNPMLAHTTDNSGINRYIYMTPYIHIDIYCTLCTFVHVMLQ